MSKEMPFSFSGDDLTEKEVRSYLSNLISYPTTTKIVKDSAKVVLDDLLEDMKKRAVLDAQKDDF